jgi:hypothetical protein
VSPSRIVKRYCPSSSRTTPLLLSGDMAPTSCSVRPPAVDSPENQFSLFLGGERAARFSDCRIRVRSEEDRVRRPLPRPAPTEAQDSFFALPAPQGRHFGCCVRLGRPDQPRRSPSCAEPIARPDPQRRMHAADNRPRGAGRDTQTSGTPTYPNSGCQRIYRKPVSWLKKGFLAVAKGPHQYYGEPFF